MEDQNKPINDIVSQILESSTFKTLVTQAVSNFNNRQNGNCSTEQTSASTSAIIAQHTLLPSSSYLPNASAATCGQGSSLIRNLKSLFPSTRGKMPSFSKSKKKDHCSPSFYRDVILLTNARAVCTLKGAKKTQAYDAGLAIPDVKFNCTWEKEQIVQYFRELFSSHLQEVSFEILLPECGRLIKIDESREALDGYKLKRMFLNRKAIYLRPFSDLTLLSNDEFKNNDSSSLCSTLSLTEDNFDYKVSLTEDNFDYKDDEADNSEPLENTDENENKLNIGDDMFERDLQVAIQNSINESEEELVTTESLLKKLSKSINDNTVTVINVVRKEVFASCVRATRRKKFQPFNKLDVIFTDYLENPEGAIDMGGPRREMFRLLLKELQNGVLFDGTEKKYLSLNTKSLEKNDYFEAGKLIALGIVHVGQGPMFFSDLLFSVLAHGIEATKPTEEFLDSNTLMAVYKLRNTNVLSELQDFIVNDSIFSIAGIDFIYKLEEKPEIIQRLLKFCCFYRVKAAIDQFVEGLKTCGIYDLLQKHPDLFYPLMCTSPRLTSDIIFDLFEICHSPIGSNKREVENKIIGFWRDYVLDCEEVESTDEGIMLGDILSFATGSSTVPILGFDVKPTIHFIHHPPVCEHSTVLDTRRRHFPEANTCSLQLHLPVVHTIYDTFKEDLDFGIRNGECFGKA